MRTLYFRVPLVGACSVCFENAGNVERFALWEVDDGELILKVGLWHTIIEVILTSPRRL